MVHESRLIPLFIYESRLNKKNYFRANMKNQLIFNHKSQITIHEKKNRPIMLYVNSREALLSITDADSQQVLFISSNTWHTCI